MRLARFGSVLVAAMVLADAATSQAQDWYVDAVNGNDANAGTTPAQAWRTISHAVASTPAGGVTQRIHVAPGTHDAALGESATIALGEGQQLLGSGPGRTIFVSPSVAFTISHSPALPYPAITGRTRLAGMSVQGAQQGLWIGSTWGSVQPVLSDLEFSGSSLHGVIINSGAVNGAVAPLLERVRCTGNSVGLALGTSNVALTDCTFDFNLQHGIAVAAWLGVARATFARCRSEGNGGRGIQAEAFNGGYELVLADVSSSRNLGSGFAGFGFPGSVALASFDRSTIAHNGGPGVALSGTEPGTTLRSSIVFGNADDLVYGAPLALVDHCDIGDGDFAGLNGNFAADPLFVSAATGDLRLGWGSPCIGAAHPALPPDARDLSGLPRPIDGNLDTVEGPDVGAFEFAPLFSRTPTQSGGALVLECWGEPGASSIVYFSRRPLASAPQSTPFGQFDLDPTGFGPFKLGTAAPGPPGLVQRNVPPSPELVGRTFCFQARASSSVAPQGSAYTNPVAVTILP